jgi:hypothetical protein
VGFVLTRLHDGGDAVPLEGLPFEDVAARLAAALRPHTVEFMRYDYRRNGESTCLLRVD